MIHQLPVYADIKRSVFVRPELSNLGKVHVVIVRRSSIGCGNIELHWLSLVDWNGRGACDNRRWTVLMCTVRIHRLRRTSLIQIAGDIRHPSAVDSVVRKPKTKRKENCRFPCLDKNFPDN